MITHHTPLILLSRTIILSYPKYSILQHIYIFSLLFLFIYLFAKARRTASAPVPSLSLGRRGPVFLLPGSCGVFPAPASKTVVFLTVPACQNFANAAKTPHTATFSRLCSSSDFSRLRLLRAAEFWYSGAVRNITVFSYGPETPPKPPPEKKYSSSPTQADAFLWLCGRVVLD